MRLGNLICAGIITLCFGGCDLVDKQKRLLEPKWHNQGDDGTVLVVGLQDAEALRASAEALGLAVTGEAVLELAGPRQALARLTVGEQEVGFHAIVDEPMEVREAEDSIELDDEIFYLAKRDFGLPEYWREFPACDGRGVVVGVIDDGVSPLQSGFRLTSAGARKYLRHGSQSSLFNVALKPAITNDEEGGFHTTYDRAYDAVWVGMLDEAAMEFDLNGDGDGTSRVDVAVFDATGVPTVCVDSNVNLVVDPQECFGTFSQTGEYGYWTSNRLVAILAEVDLDAKLLVLNEGEGRWSGDGHGEGVASVLTGHKIGGRFNGVAPGAQLIDYDLSELAHEAEELHYTVGTFVRALEWMGQNGAEVANISYSLYFMSAQSQWFIQKALESVVNRYNLVVSFSAGNNGPGLGSFNRGLVYPANVLVAGAFASKDLYEYVHGVTGLPEPGRVVYYSSRGPAPDGGATPVVISPLASLTHASPASGYQAFSGTSSASPALAGLAAVLISAAKQEGLSIDATAVVHAIRMSGARLADVPYVEQGTGLPNIRRALKMYRRMVAGTDFAYVRAMVSDDGPDGVSRSGVFLRASQGSSSFETKVYLRGVLAGTAPEGTGGEILKTTRVEYSHPAIQGPSRSYLSANWSTLVVTVETQTIVSSLTREAAEFFGEILIIDDETNNTLHTVPVTVVHDVDVSWVFVMEEEVLGPEESVRYHFNVRPGVDGFRVRIEVLEGDPNSLIARVYNPSSTTVRYYSIGGTLSETFIKTPRPGWHQVTLARRKGGESPLRFRGQVEELVLALHSAALSIGSPTVELENHGLRQDVQVSVWRTPTKVDEKIVVAGTNEVAIGHFTVTHQGAYSFAVESTTVSEVSYWRPSCAFYELDSAGDKTLLAVFGSYYTAPLRDLGHQFELHCRPFEYDPLAVGSGGTVVWKMTAHAAEQRTYEVLGQGFGRLETGVNQVQLFWRAGPDGGVEPQERVSVVVAPLFATPTSTSALELGSVILY